MKDLLNIKEFAKLAGVSTATVSRCFSKRNKVSPKTLNEVLELAKKRGFRPNQVAKSSFGGKTRSVGVLLCNLGTSYFADIATGIQQVMLLDDYLPIIISVRQESDAAALHRLIDHRVDGIIACVSDISLSKEELSEIRRFKLPMVTIDGFFNQVEWDNVRCDEVACGRLAAEYLIRCGHRKFGMISSALGIGPSALRFQSFVKTAGQLGVPVDKSAIFTSENRLSADIDSEICSFLRNLGTGYAFYCFNDNEARHLYKAAQQLKWRIPDDISVVGTADLNYAQFLIPPLTTIRQNGMEVGRIAGKIILERINGNDDSYCHVNIDVNLIERNSVKINTRNEC